MKFRKKPVVIEAEQYDGTPECAKAFIEKYKPDVYWGENGDLLVDTLEKKGLIISPMDWLITGVKGEHYPCKPDILEMTYEPAGEVNTFDVLKEMARQKIMTFHSYSEDDVRSVTVGSVRWGGRIEMAISIEDARCLMNDTFINPATEVCLLVWSLPEFERIKNELKG